MTAKRFLSGAKYIERRIDRAQDELARIRARVSRASAVVSGMPRGGGGSDWTDLSIKAVELEELLIRETAELMAIKTAAHRAIDEVEDERYRNLLRLRYCDYKSWDQIAVEMNYSYDHIIRMHGLALKMVRVPDKDDAQ